MAIDPGTKELLKFLKNNPSIRAQIKAPHNQTFIYAGDQILPAWKEIHRLKIRDPRIRLKLTLPDVLGKIRLTDAQFPTLHAWALAVDKIEPWRSNGFIAWKALSGIFAANASGQVSFVVGSGVTKEQKVFAATELPVLLRNPKIDAQTRDILSYYDRCLKFDKTALDYGALNFGFVGG